MNITQVLVEHELAQCTGLEKSRPFTSSAVDYSCLQGLKGLRSSCGSLHPAAVIHRGLSDLPYCHVRQLEADALALSMLHSFAFLGEFL